MWRPSRSDQKATEERNQDLPRRHEPGKRDGASAPTMPTAPSPKVQVASTQPELRLWRQISQAPVMIADSASATAMTVRRTDRPSSRHLRMAAARRATRDPRGRVFGIDSLDKGIDIAQNRGEEAQRQREKAPIMLRWPTHRICPQRRRRRRRPAGARQAAANCRDRRGRLARRSPAAPAARRANMCEIGCVVGSLPPKIVLQRALAQRQKIVWSGNADQAGNIAIGREIRLPQASADRARASRRYRRRPNGPSEKSYRDRRRNARHCPWPSARRARRLRGNAG